MQCPRRGLEPGPLVPESSALTMMQPMPSTMPMGITGEKCPKISQSECVLCQLHATETRISAGNMSHLAGMQTFNYFLPTLK